MSSSKSSILTLLSALLLLLSGKTNCQRDSWNPIEDAGRATAVHRTAGHLVARARQAGEEGTISNQCAADFYILETAMKDPDNYTWAAYMANANGEFPLPGLYSGRFQGLGDYDQCLNARATGQMVNLTNDQLGNSTFVGRHVFGSKYCRMTWAQHEYTNGVSLGVCVPDSCTRNDMLEIMPNATIDIHKRVYCGFKPALATNPGGIFAIAIIMIFIIIIIISSVLDACLECQRKRNHRFQSENKIADQNEANGVELQENGVGGQQRSTANTATPAVEEPTHSKSGGKLLKVLLPFSLQRNVASVTSTTGVRATYGCINGVRFFSFTWIVIGHTWKLETMILTDPRNAYVANYYGQFYYLVDPLYAFIQNMEFAVDSFFLISAALVMVSFIKTVRRVTENKDGRRALLWIKELLLFVVHRYIRLTPVYAAVLLVYSNLWMYLGSGPLFPEFQAQADNCRMSWWANLFYINNYIGAGCMGWTWYLAADFQFYCIVPFFAAALYLKPKLGYILLIMSWFGQIIIRAGLISFLGEDFWQVYVKPYARAGPYLSGLALGYALYRTQCHVKMKKIVLIGCWTTAIVISLYALTGNRNFSKPYNIFYDTMKRDLMTFGVAWVIFACCTGYGGVINSFLSWKLWLPLSRLSYTGYLIHAIVHVIALGNRRQLLYVKDITMWYWYFGNLMMTIIASFVLTLIFEVPFMELEKNIRQKK